MPPKKTPQAGSAKANVKKKNGAAVKKSNNARSTSSGPAKKAPVKRPSANSSAKGPAKKVNNKAKSTTSAAKAPAKKSTTKPAPKAGTKNVKSSDASVASSKRQSNSSAKSIPKNSKRDSAASTPNLTVEEKHIQKLLGDGAYHLPGYGWWQDWRQHLVNGHPLFSVCCQHRLHPVSKSMRAVQLLGSTAMGLIITNIIYIGFIHNDNQDAFLDDLTKSDASGQTDSVVRMSGLTEEQQQLIEEYTEVQFSAGMFVLWTVGSAAHAIFDSSMFYITSCACCKWDQANPMMQKTKRICNVFVIIGVILITAVASVAIIMRVILEGGGEVTVAELSSGTGGIETEQLSNKDNYEFLLSYALELASSWLIFFPFVDTILLSGVLSRCCPCLGGGRPAEVREEEAAARGDVEQGRPNKK